MCDIQESLHIALNNIKFNIETITKNGFIISSDPVNTKLILKNVTTLAELDIRDVIRKEPAILKNNFQSLLEIKDILEVTRFHLHYFKKVNATTNLLN